MTDARVHLDLDGAVATLRLDRPDKLHALDMDMLRQLDAHVERLDRDASVRVVLLTATGDRAFCVGADIDAWSTLDPLLMWGQWIREGHRLFDRIARLRPPVIAVLNGYTFGGGLELALAADLRLAAEGAQLALPEVRLGTIPGWGGTQRLPALIGPARARQLIFTGARIDAATAAQWGLVNDVHPPETLAARARELADTIARNAPLAVQTAKQLIDGGFGPAGTALEALASGLTASTHDLREGLAAFRERRDPSFKGR